MDAIAQLKYYTKQCTRLMNNYEESTKTMMGVNHSDLEKAIWNASDERDLIRLKVLHARLCKLVDDSVK